MPSLNRASPVILVNKDWGTPALRSSPSTAMASVGEISAPKIRQSMSGIAVPSQRTLKKNAKPMSTVDRATPIVASDRMAHRERLSAETSRCKLPANKRSPRSPWKMRPGKSSIRTVVRPHAETSGKNAPRAIITSEISSAMAVIPMVSGSRMTRQFMYPLSATTVMTAATTLKTDIGIPVVNRPRSLPEPGAARRPRARRDARLKRRLRSADRPTATARL